MAFNVDPSGNTYYDCRGLDSFGDFDQGVLFFDFQISGEALDLWIDSDPLVFSFQIEESTSIVDQVAGDGEVLEFGFQISYETYLLEGAKSHWVKWTKIGSLDFELDQSNLAGEAPVKLKGSLWKAKKLDAMVVLYGENGIARMVPKEQYWGQKIVYRVGIMGRNAIAATDDMHWCVDVEGRLLELSTNRFDILDYRASLSVLSDPVLSYDPGESLLYLCDGTKGFVYNAESKSLTKGPANITGIGYQDGTTYPVASSAITMPAFSAVSDILDFGTRKEKTIFDIECHTTFAQQLQVRVYFREFHTASFVTTPWFTFTPRGEAHCPCQGVEFKVEVKTSSYEASAVLDQLKINGVIHGFSFLDTFTNR